jgi:hypothetical protein
MLISGTGLVLACRSDSESITDLGRDTVSPQRELSRTFVLSGLSLLSPLDTMFPQRILSRILPSVVFIFHFTFKSPTILSS